MITIDSINRLEDTLAVEPKNPYALNELRTAQSNDKQIKKLVKAIRQRRNWISMHEAKLDDMRDQLQALLEAQGTNWQDDVGYARLIPESKRTSYDSKALDDLILRDPAFDCLRAYRRESKIRGSVQVK